MNHTIKITVGSCSVEAQGEKRWTPLEIEQVVEALTKASIENGEQNAKAEVEMGIGTAGDDRPWTEGTGDLDLDLAAIGIKPDQQ